MFIAAALALIVSMALVLIRAFIGSTIYDHILAVNVFGTKALLLIAVMGFLTGRPEFLDIALVYALINFIGTIAIMKFFKFSHLGHPYANDSLGICNHVYRYFKLDLSSDRISISVDQRRRHVALS